MIRFFDILLSFIGLIVLSPVFFTLAIWIRIDSKGPVFYKQLRVGEYNKDFLLLKFRSMHIDSDQKGLLTVGLKDPRITRSGVFIRRYKLDEFPQLINVLKGEMSLVGPRPEVRKYVDLYNENQKRILLTKPGITDYASIEYSNENEVLAKADNAEAAYINEIMPHKISLNLKYINNITLYNYFKIMFLTIIKIVH